MDYIDPTLFALDIALVACCAGDAEDRCGLDVDDAETIFPGFQGCIALDQPSEEGTWNCESFSMSTDVGAVTLPGCCRAGLDTCGIDLDAGPSGGCFPPGPGPSSGRADFGCVDPMPLLDAADGDDLSDFWRDGDDKVSTAPKCEPI